MAKKKNGGTRKSSSATTGLSTEYRSEDIDFIRLVTVAAVFCTGGRPLNKNEDPCQILLNHDPDVVFQNMPPNDYMKTNVSIDGEKMKLGEKIESEKFNLMSIKLLTKCLTKNRQCLAKFVYYEDIDDIENSDVISDAFKMIKQLTLDLYPVELFIVTVGKAATRNKKQKPQYAHLLRLPIDVEKETLEIESCSGPIEKNPLGKEKLATLVDYLNVGVKTLEVNGKKYGGQVSLGSELPPPAEWKLVQNEVEAFEANLRTLYTCLSPPPIGSQSSNTPEMRQLKNFNGFIQYFFLCLSIPTGCVDSYQCGLCDEWMPPHMLLPGMIAPPSVSVNCALIRRDSIPCLPKDEMGTKSTLKEYTSRITKSYRMLTCEGGVEHGLSSLKNMTRALNAMGAFRFPLRCCSNELCKGGQSVILQDDESPAAVGTGICGTCKLAACEACFDVSKQACIKCLPPADTCIMDGCQRTSQILAYCKACNATACEGCLQEVYLNGSGCNVCSGCIKDITCSCDVCCTFDCTSGRVVRNGKMYERPFLCTCHKCKGVFFSDCKAKKLSREDVECVCGGDDCIPLTSYKSMKDALNCPYWLCRKPITGTKGYQMTDDMIFELAWCKFTTIGDDYQRLRQHAEPLSGAPIPGTKAAKKKATQKQDGQKEQNVKSLNATVREEETEKEETKEEETADATAEEAKAEAEAVTAKVQGPEEKDETNEEETAEAKAGGEAVAARVQGPKETDAPPPITKIDGTNPRTRRGQTKIVCRLWHIDTCRRVTIDKEYKEDQIVAHIFFSGLDKAYKESAEKYFYLKPSDITSKTALVKKVEALHQIFDESYQSFAARTTNYQRSGRSTLHIPCQEKSTEIRESVCNNYKAELNHVTIPGDLPDIYLFLPYYRRFAHLLIDHVKEYIQEDSFDKILISKRITPNEFVNEFYNTFCVGRHNSLLAKSTFVEEFWNARSTDAKFFKGDAKLHYSDATIKLLEKYYSKEIDNSEKPKESSKKRKTAPATPEDKAKKTKVSTENQADI